MKNALDIVDSASGQITDEVALSGRPNNIAVTKDGGRVLVAIRGGKGGLDVVDPPIRRLVESIPVGGQLHNVYATPDGKYAVAGSIADHMITVFDLATDQPAWGVRADRAVNVAVGRIAEVPRALMTVRSSPKGDVAAVPV